MMRPSDGGTRGQEHECVEQRKLPRIEGVTEGTVGCRHGRPFASENLIPANNANFQSVSELMDVAWKEGDVEISPEPGHEEHHFGGDEQEHAVAQRKLHNGSMIALIDPLDDDIPPPEEHGAKDSDKACDKHPGALHTENAALPAFHPYDGTDCHDQPGNRADDRPRAWVDEVVVVMFGVISHLYLRRGCQRSWRKFLLALRPYCAAAVVRTLPEG